MAIVVATLGIPKVRYYTLPEGRRFRLARLVVMDWPTMTRIKTVDYESPDDHIGPECSILFKGGCQVGTAWYQVTSTEIMRYGTDNWALEAIVSLPTFNDLHGITGNAEMVAVANTGLETVVFLRPSTLEVCDEVSLAPERTAEIRGMADDLRQVASTKPHPVHVNHVFRVADSWWATRFAQKDAISLGGDNRRISIGVGNPHDGHVHGDVVYFTTTNGFVVIASPTTGRIEESIDLKKIVPSKGPLGWCRGLGVLNDSGTRVLVGLTRLRVSRFKAYADWLTNIKKSLNTCICEIDVERKELVRQYFFDGENEKESAVYTVAVLSR